MTGPKKPTPTQGKILANLAAGRRWDQDRPIGMSAAGGWDGSYLSCARAGWLNYTIGEITDAGRQAIEGRTE